MLEVLQGLWHLSDPTDPDSGVLMFGADALFDFLASVALYITIALLVGIVAYAIVLRNKSEEHLAGARKTILGVIVGYSVGVLGVLGVLKLAIKITEEAFDTNFWVVFGMLALLIVGVVACFVTNKFAPKATKWVGLAFAVAFVAYAVAISVAMPAVDESYNAINNQDWLFVIVTLALVAGIVVLALIGDKNAQFDTKALAYGAICVALSFALSYIKFFSLPQGGSVTFASLLPLALYSFMFGTRRGVIVGVVYGMLQFVQSPQFYHPVQVLVDYPIAFGAIGLAGIGKKFAFAKGNLIAQFALGTTIAVLFRYVAHVISGYFVFYSWAPVDEGYTALTWTLLYNLFTLADLAVVLVMGVVGLSTSALKRTVMHANSQE